MPPSAHASARMAMGRSGQIQRCPFGIFLSKHTAGSGHPRHSALTCVCHSMCVTMTRCATFVRDRECEQQPNSMPPAATGGSRGLVAVCWRPACARRACGGRNFVRSSAFLVLQKQKTRVFHISNFQTERAGGTSHAHAAPSRAAPHVRLRWLAARPRASCARRAPRHPRAHCARRAHSHVCCP